MRKRSRGICEFAIRGVCRGRAVHFHHKRLRSQGGRDQRNNLAHVCFACHRYAHEHVQAAYDNGWIRRGKVPDCTDTGS